MKRRRPLMTTLEETFEAMAARLVDEFYSRPMKFRCKIQLRMDIEKILDEVHEMGYSSAIRPQIPKTGIFIEEFYP